VSRSLAATLAVAVAAAIAVAFLGWPGFMTFDSVFALQQARGGIVNGGYPPMISYLWRVAELFVAGQGGMFFLQLLLVFTGVLACVWWMSRSVTAAVLAALLLPLLSATGGPLLMVWKDVLFGGAAMCALLVAWAVTRAPALRPGMKALAFALLVFAASLRLNALPALVPGFWLLAAAPGQGDWRISARRVLLSGALAIAAAAFVFALSLWRLPDLERIPPQSSQRYGMFHDLLGISACMGVQVFDPAITHGRPLDAGGLRHVYHPEHVQMSFSVDHLDEKRLDTIDASAWWREVRNHPSCYAWHKSQLIKYMLGLNSGKVYYVIDPGVFPNDMGLATPDPEKVGLLLEPVLSGQATPGARAAVYLVLALLLAGACRLRYGRFGLAGMLLLSSALYFGASMLVYPAADLRYQYFEILAAFAIVLGCGASLIRGKLPQ